jgi:hypothetical protein
MVYLIGSVQLETSGAEFIDAEQLHVTTFPELLTIFTTRSDIFISMCNLTIYTSGWN